MMMRRSTTTSDTTATTTTTTTTTTLEEIDAEEARELSLFRHVHSAANDVRGRAIPLILYERSIAGPRIRSLILNHHHPHDRSPLVTSEEEEEEESLSFKSTTKEEEDEEEVFKSPHTVAIAVPMPSSSNNNNDNDSSSMIRKKPRLFNFSEEYNNNSLTRQRRRLVKEIQLFAEFSSVTRYHWSYLNLVRNTNNNTNNNDEQQHHHHRAYPSPYYFGATIPPQPRRLIHPSSGSSSISTISISFSPDGRTFASTHGDHTVKITCCHTGRLIRVLEGHPRTPWTVKYHPKNNHIVASGCLGFQVRVWNWNRIRHHPTKQKQDQDDPYNYQNGEGVCLNMIRLQYAIISLSFHTSGCILAVASGQTLHLWDYCDYAGKKRDEQQQQQQQPSVESSTTNHTNTNQNHRRQLNYHDNSNSSNTNSTQQMNNNNTHNNSSSSSSSQQQRSTTTSTRGSTMSDWSSRNHHHHTNEFYESRSVPTRRGTITEIRYDHALRCVHFPPNGNTIIIGGVNPSDPTLIHNAQQRGGMSGGGMSFSLRLWDFDLEAALYPHLYLNHHHHPINEENDHNNNTNNNSNTTTHNNNNNNSDSNSDDENDATNNNNNNNNERGRLRVRREAISNSRVFVPRALLYNDGGFDVSPDGKMLCACAEYWLPDGVNSVMELLEPQQENQEQEDPQHNTPTNTTHNNTQKDHTPATNMNANPSERTTSTTNTTITTNTEDGTSERRATTDGNTTTSTTMDRQISSTTEHHSDSIPSPPRNHTAPAAPVPRTPPNPPRPQMPLSPPSPPGRRFHGGLASRRRQPSSSQHSQQPDNAELVRIANQSLSSVDATSNTGTSNTLSRTDIIMARMMMNQMHHQPHPLCLVGRLSKYRYTAPAGRYVPHVVTVNLDSTNTKRTNTQQQPQNYLGQLLQASPLDAAKASGVTCVKFSPSTEYCLLGYGVRDTLRGGGGSSSNDASQQQPSSSQSSSSQTTQQQESSRYHPVTAVYKVDGMKHVSTMLSGDDDVNIARFHPQSGHGFVYGTKQGRVRNMSTRPWNYYHND